MPRLANPQYFFGVSVFFVFFFLSNAACLVLLFVAVAVVVLLAGFFSLANVCISCCGLFVLVGVGN